jgi:hypothetical protein
MSGCAPLARRMHYLAAMNRERGISHEPVESASQGLRDAVARTDRGIRQFARQRPLVATFLAMGAGFVVGRLLTRARRW